MIGYNIMKRAQMFNKKKNKLRKTAEEIFGQIELHKKGVT
jgi:hypothetical protein